MGNPDPDLASPELPVPASLAFSITSARDTLDNCKLQMPIVPASCLILTLSKAHPNHYLMLGPNLYPCLLSLEQGWRENAES